MSNETPYEATDVVCTSYFKSPKLCNKWIIKGRIENISIHKTEQSEYVLITFTHDLDHRVIINNGIESESYGADEIKFVLKQIYDRKEPDFIERIIRGYLVSVGCAEPDNGIKYFHNFNSIMIWKNSNYKIPRGCVEGSRIAVSVVDNQISIKNNGELNFINHRVCSDIVAYEQYPDLVTTIRKSNERKAKMSTKEGLAQSKDADLFKTPPRVKRTDIKKTELVSVRKVHEKAKKNLFADFEPSDDDTAITE